MKETNSILTGYLKLNVDWDVGEWPNIFKFIQIVGNVPTDDMKKSFNLGIGMVLIIKKDYISDAETYLKNINENYYIIGEIN